MKLKTCISILFLWFAIILLAQAPEGYYKNAEGKKDAALKTALFQIIYRDASTPETSIPRYWSGKYSAAAGFFETADRTADGYIWDMYSNKQCVRWSGCGLNREHNLPKSWFGISGGSEDKESIGCDYHNLYPSDASPNSAKSNYPLGMVSSATYNNGVVKVGTSAISISGYTGRVFEPADEYKGDFARCYMYMVTCYENYANRWVNIGTQSMLQNNTYPTLKPYAVDLLIKWHRDDPVSEKEINRNNEVYRVQGNRNPFVDFPELAEHIWGNLKNTVWRDTDKFYIIYDKKTKKLSASLNNPENGEGNVEIRILNEKFSSNSTVDVIIYNVAGMKILSEKLNSDSTIDLSQLPKGIYVILAYGDSIRGAEKFLVQ